jgi:hypothetical protein
VWLLPRNHPLCSPSAPATADSSEPSPEHWERCASSLTWRGKPTPPRTWLRRWKRVPWFRHLCGRMLSPLHGTSFEAALKASLPAIPASRRARLESGWARRTRDGFGRSSGMQWQLFDLPGVSSRTSRDTLPAGLSTSSTTWGEWVTALRLACTKRGKLAHRIGGAESSSWPTPTTADSRNTRNATSGRSMGGGSHHSGVTLCDAVRLWPTPRASDAQRGSWDGRPRGREGRPLCEVIHGQPDLRSPSTPGNRHAQLNPDWVEGMMGLPRGWTAFACSETAWSSSRQSSPSGICGATSSRDP